MKGMPGFGIQMSYVQMRRGLPLARGICIALARNQLMPWLLARNKIRNIAEANKELETVNQRSAFKQSDKNPEQLRIL